MPFVNSDHNHLVVLHTSLKDVIKSQYFALLRYLNQTKTRLAQVELSVDLRDSL